MIAPQRFWTEVAVEPVPAGYALRLDARRLCTPAGAEMHLPTRALAEAVACEWREVQGELHPEAMPLTRYANAVIDRVAPDPGPVVDLLASYGQSDLLCYRATEPEALVLRQAAAWDPWLAWAEARLGAPLIAACGIMPVEQPAPSLARLRAAVAAGDPFGLAALHDLVVLSGSLVLGLAVRIGAVPALDAWELSRLDETWQAELWGRDSEAEAAVQRSRADFLRAARLVEMLADA